MKSLLSFTPKMLEQFFDYESLNTRDNSIVIENAKIKKPFSKLLMFNINEDKIFTEIQFTSSGVINLCEDTKTTTLLSHNLVEQMIETNISNFVEESEKLFLTFEETISEIPTKYLDEMYEKTSSKIMKDEIEKEKNKRC